MKVQQEELRLKGIPICRGVAIGKPFFFIIKDDDIPNFTISKKEVESEVIRYRSAVKRSLEDIKKLKTKLKREKITEGEAILDTHLEIIQDPLITVEIEGQISSQKKNAESVFHQIVTDYQKKFQSMTDPFFRERFKDLQDVSRRVMGYLRQGVRVSFVDIPRNSIVFSEEITATDTVESNASCVKAFVTSTGSATSHAAIVAKAKGIPYVSDVEFETVANLEESSQVIVDGRSGEVIIHPTDETLAEYEQIQYLLTSQEIDLEKMKGLLPETIDGYRVNLAANIDMTGELDTVHQYGGHGVGLFRSEYIFLSSKTFPTEDEQFTIYFKAVKKMGGEPIVIRTFDFGGDKMVLNQHVPLEGNPFLGSHAIRFLLKERDIFKVQLKAILRASAFGQIRIMFPMISALSELLEAKAILEDAKSELIQRGESIDENISVGCMIEVPSAAIIADLLAKECDFLSIGTNDLVQYSLAVDRRSHSSGGHYAPTDPSVIRMIKLVVSEANLQSIPVTVCGEVAADPRVTPLLLGLGVHELSVAPRYIPIVKRSVRQTSIVEACHLAETALSLTCAREIFDLLSQKYQAIAPDDRFYHYS